MSAFLSLSQEEHPQEELAPARMLTCAWVQYSSSTRSCSISQDLKQLGMMLKIPLTLCNRPRFPALDGTSPFGDKV